MHESGPCSPLVTDNVLPPGGRVTLTACGRQWTLVQAGDMEALWQQLDEDEFGEDERLPYWVEVWPASQALAEHLGEKAGLIRGRTCLDVGCGLGLTAMVGAWLGGRVLGLDYEPQALCYARANAALNKVDNLSLAVMDWRAPALAPGSVDRVWGGDILYEKRFYRPLERFFAHVLAPGGRIWLAEPRRDVSAEAMARFSQEGWRVSGPERGVGRVGEWTARVNFWELQRT